MKGEKQDAGLFCKRGNPNLSISVMMDFPEFPPTEIVADDEVLNDIEKFAVVHFL